MDKKRSSFLLLFTGSNFFITYLTGVLLARMLGVEGYDEYAVAVALVTILSTLAELGTGKYAMRILPVYVERREWGAARGYRRWAARTVLVASALLVAVFAVPGVMTTGLQNASATVVALCFLPALALVGYGAEVVQANGATLFAAILSRVVVPGVTLVLVAAYGLVAGDLSAIGGVVLFGLGWVAGLLLLRFFLVRTTPREVTAADPVMSPWAWLGGARPFLVFALLVVALTKVSLIVFKQVGAGPDVSVFAAALETGSFIYLIAKSTDKMFLPQIATALERKDANWMLAERRRRLIWIAAICGGFLAVVVIFGREILGLYGPDFVEGYWALVVVSAATAIQTLFSLAPSYLKYVGKKHFVNASTAVAVAGVVALTWLLGARYGATGAAIGYGLPTAALYVLFSLVGTRDVRVLLAATETIERDLEAEDDDEFAF